MDAAALIRLVVVVSVVLIVTSIGMATRPGAALRFLRSPVPIAKAMLAMFVAMPLFAIAVALVLPLEPAVRVALLALAISPMPPVFPRRAGRGEEHADHVIGLQVAASVFALAAAPAWVLVIQQVFGRELALDLGAMALVLLVTVGAPLLVGILIHRFAPRFAAAVRHRLGLVGMVTLGGAALMIVALSWQEIWGAIGNGTLGAILLMTVFGLAAGHLLGGPGADTRRSLAIATASRHPGVAIVLGTMVYPDKPKEIVGAVFLYLLASAVFSLPYIRAMKGRD